MHLFRQRLGLRNSVLAGILVAIGLCSCQQSGWLFSARLAQPTDSRITVTLSGWQSNPNEKKLLDQVIQQFERQHPNIKVKHEVINSEYMDVIRTRLIGDVAPDVFYLDAFEAPMLMKYQVLEPLDAYITADFDLADFEPALLNAFKYNQQLYGLPKDFSTLALIYNKAAFTQAGIAQPPQTWEEFLQVSQQLTIDRNQDRRIDQYGFGLAPELARQVFAIQAFGGSLLNSQGYAAFAESRGLQGLKLVVDQYRIARTSAQPTDVGATWGSEMLGQEKAAMVIEGTWAIPYFQETFPNLEIGTAEVPKMNNRSGTMVFTVAYVMNRKAKHKAAAWTLISYLTGRSGMKAWATQGFALPTRRSVLAELGYDRHPLYAPFVAGANYATIWQAGEHLPTIRINFNNQFTSALLGEQPLEAAMQKAQQTANREIFLSN
jgi:multiple sugar transport system substrate-binding protein